ncbi:MAG: alcohol dehydrogenase catalytic domain-containing protein [Lachnospiraceae bacterium]|nr:alcohol dehydrogenase catalytic domain-containing protein [Lachnospiraceae bacterium]
MVSRTMKAWILTQPEKLELKEIPVPVPAENQVLVKIDRACICNGSDPGIYHGHEAYQTPLIFGHEASGRIVQKGSAVTQFEVGDRVCWWFEAGAFAEYQTVTPGNVAMFLVPETITMDQAPVMELVLAACRALMKFPPANGRRKLSICGLGPSGLVLIQYARALGYEQIIGWDLYESRRDLGKRLGADLVYDPRTVIAGEAGEIPESDIGVIMMGDDMLPGEPTATAFLRTVRAGGQIVSYGHPEKGFRFSPYVFQARNLKMEGPEQDMEKIRQKGAEVVQMAADGRIRIEPLITHRVAFEDFLPAFESILKHPEERIKVILKWREAQ